MGNLQTNLQIKAIRVWAWLPVIGLYPAMFKMEYVDANWPITFEGLLNAVYQMTCLGYLITKLYG